jgi:ABC-2 type transport system ATP-binding protein
LVHIQNMDELRSVQHVQIRFIGPAPPPPEVSGLEVRQRQGDRLSLAYRGELRPLLRWLAQQPVAELHIEQLGLLEIYHRYHGIHP